MRQLRPPVPNAHLAKIERCRPEELLGLFEVSLRTGLKRAEYHLLADAWEIGRAHV